jgi:putative membrane protein
MGMSGIAVVGAFFFVVLLIAVIAIIAFALTRGRTATPVSFPATRETPVQMLDRRFAAGEIDAEEYKRARDLLTGDGPKA